MSSEYPLDFGSSPMDGDGLARAKKFVRQLIRNTSPNDVFDANEILRAHPGLQTYRSVVLDLAYEEYVRRIDAGEDVDQSKFIDRFGEYRDSLRSLLATHGWMAVADFSSIFQTVWPEPGDKFGPFELLEVIGRGAFAKVFVAQQLDVGSRIVVLKISPRLKGEVRTLAQLDHPNIVPIFTVVKSEDASLSAICMPYLSRATLHDVMIHAFQKHAVPQSAESILVAIRAKNGESPIKPVQEDRGKPHPIFRGRFEDAMIHVGLQLARALENTHVKGIYHCDIKPSNVLLTSSGTAMLFDFNLAFESRTDECLVGGTLPYMAPEQLRVVTHPGETPVIDARTDIFSWAITMYQLLTGQLPFGNVSETESSVKTASRLLDGQKQGPIPMRNHNPNVTPTLAKLIEDSLAWEPSARPQSVSELAHRLQREQRIDRVAGRTLRSNRKGLLISIATVGVIATGVSLFFALRPPYETRLNRQAHSLLRQHRYDEAMRLFDQVKAIPQGGFESDKAYEEAVLRWGTEKLKEAHEEHERGYFDSSEKRCVEILSRLDELADLQDDDNRRFDLWRQTKLLLADSYFDQGSELQVKLSDGEIGKGMEAATETINTIGELYMKAVVSTKDVRDVEQTTNRPHHYETLCRFAFFQIRLWTLPGLLDAVERSTAFRTTQLALEMLQHMGGENDPFVLNNLAYCYLVHSNHELAAPLLNRCRDLGLDNVAVRLNRLREAVSTLESQRQRVGAEELKSIVDEIFESGIIEQSIEVGSTTEETFTLLNDLMCAILDVEMRFNFGDPDDIVERIIEYSEQAVSLGTTRNSLERTVGSIDIVRAHRRYEVLLVRASSNENAQTWTYRLVDLRNH